MRVHILSRFDAEIAWHFHQLCVIVTQLLALRVGSVLQSRGCSHRGVSNCG